MQRSRNVIEVGQFDRPMLDSLFARTDEMRIIANAGGSNRLTGKILATLFFEPSTRTRLSFESAMMRLGGSVLTAENAIETSSWVKGETIEDTARIVEAYADAIVMRHPEAGIPARAAAVIDIPLINAGDGAREHPTQALLDLYTIGHELGRIDDLKIAFVGDLKYGRAPRSLAMLLTEASGIDLTFISPPNVRMGEDVKAELSAKGVTFEEETDLLAVLPDVDVVYQTRVQRERFTSDDEYQAARGKYVIDAAAMAALDPQAIVMHPLPRVDEIDPIVDSDRRAAYFRQARNGVYVRMAILDWLLSEE